MSTGLVNQSPDAAAVLGAMSYECVILDEAHRARRSNLGPTHQREAAQPNILLKFLQKVAPNAKSLLLATATPVQIDPIEAWDLLEALNRVGDGRARVLGTRYSRWIRFPRVGLDYVLGRAEPPTEPTETWAWLSDPLPPSDEGRDFEIIRRDLDLPDSIAWAPPEAFDQLPPGDKRRVRGLSVDLFQNHNPFIRHIVRRTRDYLENELDPETGEPYLPRVGVRLFGEKDDEAVTLPTFLRDAYEAAESFCDIVGRRPGLNSGFLKTLLLRRVGSSIVAGRKTAENMLGSSDADADEDDDAAGTARSALYPLLPAEASELMRFLDLLRHTSEEDPKAQVVDEILFRGVEGSEPWLERGCIVFSQYFDSAYWLAERLSNRLHDEAIAL
ncbi:MAG TPA: helicase SNF2, partial [Chloroflexota bacterium]|nr:helicase SNF2 [Chloroflexota bacterium]